MRRAISVTLAVLAVAGLIICLFILYGSSSQIPNPASTPPVVNESLDELLHDLEAVLNQYRPETIQSLMPGITQEQLGLAESALNQSIHPEIQALYRWHNGLGNEEELFPGYRFWELDRAIQVNQEANNFYKEKGVSLLMAHEKNWLVLFPDFSGDGYYYDLKGSYETGVVFYNFRESNYYRYFPSIKNLLRAIIDCYQNDVYPIDGDPNFEAEDAIMEKYGKEIY
jgi:cell wall assembly regulator SMI1